MNKIDRHNIQPLVIFADPSFAGDQSYIKFYYNGLTTLLVEIYEENIEYDEDDDEPTTISTKLTFNIPPKMFLAMLEKGKFDPDRTFNQNIAIHRYLGEKWGNYITTQFNMDFSYHYGKDSFSGEYIDLVSLLVSRSGKSACFLQETKKFFEQIQPLVDAFNSVKDGGLE